MRPQPRILVVEGETALAAATARWLRMQGYEVAVAHDRAGAVALGSAGGAFHCGIFALELRDGNGSDLAEELVDAGAVDRVVFFTASVDDALREQAETVGPVVSKTEPVAVLLYVVASTIADSQSVAQVVGMPTVPPPDGYYAQPSSRIRARRRG